MINCIPTDELTKSQLNSELYLLPRILLEVRRLLAKGIDPVTIERPKTFGHGTGSLKFFYVRLGWVRQRYADLIAERLIRKMKTDLDQIDTMFLDLPDHLMGDWQPSPQDLRINRKFLAEKEHARNKKPKQKLTSHKD